MSGICSQHQGHDPSCSRCTAIPLTKEDEAYYKGWNESREAMERHGWHPVEDCVLDGWDALLAAGRDVKDPPPALAQALSAIDKLKELHRGFGR